MSETVFPAKIFVSGNSLYLRGYNGEYRYYRDPLTGHAEYHQDAHILKIGLSPLSIEIFIRPTKIVKNGRWHLITNDDRDKLLMIHVKRVPGDRTPVGDWGSILVTTETNFNTWWRNNGTCIVGVVTILAFLFVVVRCLV